MTQLTKVKQNTHEHKDKTQRQTHGPSGLYELFLLTVPIEVARCQYKTKKRRSLKFASDWV